MENDKIFSLADKLKELKDSKRDLEFEIKQNNEETDVVEQELIGQMSAEELSSFKRNGVTFSLVVQEYPSAIVETKAELYNRLKANGFEHLFTVNAQTLSATVKELKSNNNDVMPKWLDGYIKIAEKSSVRIRK